MCQEAMAKALYKRGMDMEMCLLKDYLWKLPTLDAFIKKF